MFTLVPGTYELVARAAGFGHVRTTLTVRAGQLRDLRVNMRFNLASSANGATATGDGDNHAALIDDTEATNWASLGSPVAGKQVTVRLDPSRRAQTFDRIQVSAMLRHGSRPTRTTAAPEPLLGAAAVRAAGVRGARRGRLQPGGAVHVGVHERGRRVPGRRSRGRGRRT